MNIKAFIRNSILNEGDNINMSIPSDVLDIKKIFVQHGHKLYIVGGAVRDAMLGKQPKDYDLATDAKPEKVMQMLRGHYAIKETGKAFGVIMVNTGEGEYEIATFRKDIGAGRRPDSVEFTTIDQDVKRRDLTINALFYDIDTGEVVDLVGGVDDLNKGVVRTVGKAHERFSEDRLRILRAIRFAARFGSEVHTDIHNALQKDSRLGGFPEEMGATHNISAERIRDEFVKGVDGAKSVAHFLSLLKQYNMFQWVFGDLNVNEKSLNTEEHNIALLLAWLLQDNDIRLIEKKLNKLTYKTHIIDEVTFYLRLENLSPENAFLLKTKEGKLSPIIEMNKEKIKKAGTLFNVDEALLSAFIHYDLTVRGQDIVKAGFKKDAIGKEQNRLETKRFEQIWHHFSMRDTMNKGNLREEIRSLIEFMNVHSPGGTPDQAVGSTTIVGSKSNDNAKAHETGSAVNLPSSVNIGSNINTGDPKKGTTGHEVGSKINTGGNPQEKSKQPQKSAPGKGKPIKGRGQGRLMDLDYEQ